MGTTEISQAFNSIAKQTDFSLLTEINIKSSFENIQTTYNGDSGTTRGNNLNVFVCSDNKIVNTKHY